ncbi:hypothetical protein F4777DRAFT_567214 [Nemania sp. FL0916]|nr:hypothetical protein F4777DRAFT_567214 [Nemania sp. FL0916]
MVEVVALFAVLAVVVVLVLVDEAGAESAEAVAVAAPVLALESAVVADTIGAVVAVLAGRGSPSLVMVATAVVLRGGGSREDTRGGAVGGNTLDVLLEVRGGDDGGGRGCRGAAGAGRSQSAVV